MREHFISLREVSEETAIPYKTLCKVADKLDDLSWDSDRVDRGISQGVHLVFSKNNKRVVDKMYHKLFIKNIIENA